MCGLKLLATPPQSSHTTFTTTLLLLLVLVSCSQATAGDHIRRGVHPRPDVQEIPFGRWRGVGLGEGLLEPFSTFILTSSFTQRLSGDWVASRCGDDKLRGKVVVSGPLVSR